MLKALLKATIASSFYYTGLLAGYGRFLLRNKAMILMYHRVLPPADMQIPSVQPGMYVSVDNFRRQVHFLKSHFNLVSLEELVERLTEGRDVQRCCVLTFDDGWQDNFQYAFPVLQKYSVPATVFLTTGYIGTQRWFWPEEVSLCLLKSRDEVAERGVLPSFVQKELSRKGLGLKSSLERRVDCVVEFLKKKPPEQRLIYIRQLKDACGLKSNGKRLLMNWDEVREMGKSSLIEFGSHTMNHVLLDQLPLTEAQDEISLSKEVIGRKIGKKCVFFAYPNGNYNESIISSLGNAGFTAALTTKRGYVSSDSTLLELPRVGVHEDVSCNLPLFLWRLIIR